MSVRWVATALFLCAFGFYLHFAAPSVTPGDSGEFMTAAATLSLPHAPSFPLYCVAGKAVLTAVPFGSASFRCNVFSSLTSAATLTLLFVMLVSMGAALVPALLTAVVIGLTVSFWENSLVTEVFSLNAFFVVALLFCLVRRSFALFAFLLGLGVGNHQILIFIAPAFLVAVIRQWRIPLMNRLTDGIPAFTGMTALFLLGFSIYLYLPIRSAKEPPLNWGQPTTVSKIVRTITRKDYGSLNLALGDAPARNASNSARHIKNFFSHLSREVPLPALLLAAWAMVMGLLARKRSVWIALVAFVVSGPFFFLLGNLAFTAQSDGIVGRFMIFPVIALLLHLPFALERRRWIGTVALFLCAVIAFQQNIAAAQMRRSSTLVLDYGRAMLRTLPVNGTLFMDGGDDAFYSLAMLRYVMGSRPDVELHDRGGLIFKNPYGSDFRSLAKEEKQNRRWQVEQTFLVRGPLFYSTMDTNALPGFTLTQSGFLMETERKQGVPIDWPMIALRALYPLEPNDYRSRAIGVFFPFMRGRQLLAKDNVDEALPFLRRAAAMGADVDWFQNNLEAMYALEGYRFLTSGKLPAAEKIYRAWIDFNSESSAAQSNFGVVLERLGRLPEARAQYERTAALFPQMADPVFNLAVLAWKEKDWPRVVSYLEEAVRRKPDHAQAQAYLTAAREKMRSGAR